jgi:hypothetical protein
MAAGRERPRRILLPDQIREVMTELGQRPPGHLALRVDLQRLPVEIDGAGNPFLMALR